MSCLVSSASVTAKFAAVKVVADMRKDENCMLDLHATACREIRTMQFTRSAS
jgi:hypothetical protein